MSLNNGAWDFDYIATDINSTTRAAFINDDGTSTLLSTMVPKDPEGNDYDFDISHSLGYSLMHNTTIGDIDGDGSDEIIFSDYSGDVATITNQYTKVLSPSGLHFQSSAVMIIDDTGTLPPVRAAGLEHTNTKIISANLDLTTEGAVDLSDVLLQLKHIIGLRILEGVNAAAADNNADGNIDLSDVLQSLKQIIGLSNPLAKVVSTDGKHTFTFDETITSLTVIAPGDADLSWTLTDIA